ncbi:1958_t:CDS:2, partial [Ambispora leptoticha]
DNYSIFQGFKMIAKIQTFVIDISQLQGRGSTYYCVTKSPRFFKPKAQNTEDDEAINQDTLDMEKVI